MTKPASISPAIVETLYEEALFLADEARAAFALAQDPDGLAPGLYPSGSSPSGQEPARIALSCEALRTTTRMMHAIAWLLNHRAHFAGDLSEFQLRRHGRLPPLQPLGDPAQLALIDLTTLDLVDRTRAFYQRIARLDQAWQAGYAIRPSAVERLRERVDRAFLAG